MINSKDLNEKFKNFLKNINLDKYVDFSDSIISADLDKCYSYKNIWKENGIDFDNGCILYFITKISPYNSEVRDVGNKFVEPYKWVIDNYIRFKKYLE